MSGKISHQEYDTEKIRILLESAFVSKDLSNFCEDHPPLNPIPAEFKENDSLSEMVDTVIDYCRTRGLFAELLQAVKAARPDPYREFGPYAVGHPRPRPHPKPDPQPINWRDPASWPVWQQIGAAAAALVLVALVVLTLAQSSGPRSSSTATAIGEQATAPTSTATGVALVQTTEVATPTPSTEPSPTASPAVTGTDSSSTPGATATASSTATPRPPRTATVTLLPVRDESGQVRSDESSSGQAVSAGAYYVGDSAINRGYQTFLSFDLQAVPLGSTVLSAQLDLSQFIYWGPAFTLGDGCMGIYEASYLPPLRGSDYVLGEPGAPIARFCSKEEMGKAQGSQELAATIQAAVGQPRFRVRVQFRVETNHNSGADVLELRSPELLVTFREP